MKRTCKKCGVEKDLELFPKSGKYHLNICKECRYKQKQAAYKNCVACDNCKIFFMTSNAQAKNENHYCSHYCYSLSLKNKRGAYKDLTGMMFGKWTVIKDSGDRKNKTIMWLCKCDCGNLGKIAGSSLSSGDSKSCGCSMHIDMSGKRFGRLKILNEFKRKKGIIFWLCECDCGTKKFICGDPIRRGVIVSCGCYNEENRKILLKKNLEKRKIYPEDAYIMDVSKRWVKYLPDSYIRHLISPGGKIKNISQDDINLKRSEIIAIREKLKKDKDSGMTGYLRSSVELTDPYTKNLIAHRSVLRHKNITPEMIELKRELLTFYRLEKELTNGINDRRNKRNAENGKAA